MNKKVVVTGYNMITSLGLNVDDSWQNLIEGKSGVKKISLFDPSNHETQIAAQVSEEFDDYSKGYVKKRAAKQMTRVTKMCLVCAKEAISRSNINFDELEKDRCGVVLGVVNTGNSSVEKGTNSKNIILKGMNNAMSAWIALEYNLGGPNFTLASACSSSAHAIGTAYDLIKSGRADMVITGGADSVINPEEVAGFNGIYALSTANEHPQKASKPFSKNRDGFVIGEGSGIIILESEESAIKRNAKIYAEVVDYAITCESYNIMAPKKDGEGMADTMELAIKNSGVNRGEINYINAHGTSTNLNDKFETMAIKKVFGDNACNIPVSSSKSMIGHTIGAAGAIEAIICVKSIETDIIHPTINLDETDPELDLDYVPNHSRKHIVNYALSNSFAFGGHNSTIIFKKYL